MPTLWEYLTRADPLAGLTVVPVVRYWDRPVDEGALYLGAPTGTRAEIIGGEVTRDAGGALALVASISATIVPNPSALPTTPGYYLMGMALADADRVLALDLFDSPKTADPGQSWDVLLQLYLIGPGEEYA